jgi:general secretion pathway protein B
MSNLLNAIEQSEQGHSAQQPQPVTTHQVPHGNATVHPLKQDKATLKVPSWVLPVVIAVLPAVLIVSYKVTMSSETVATVQPLVSSIQPREEGVIAPERAIQSVATVKPVKAKPTRVSSADGQFVFLSYPELVTEPLPLGDSQYLAQPAYAELQPDNRSASVPVSRKEAERYTAENASSDRLGAADTDLLQLDNLDLSGLSPQLARQLKSAIAATDETPYYDNEPAERRAAPQTNPEPEVVPLGQLPVTVQERLPSLNFEQHIYSSTPESRWVKVNGREMFEGDEIEPGVKIYRIDPRQVVLAFDNYLVAMPALSEW